MAAKPKSKRLKVYWDTCVIIAWVKDEHRKPGEMENLYAVAQDILNNRVVMFTGSTAFGEITQSSLTSAQLEKLNGLFSRSNTDVVNIDVPVATLTGEIKQYYRQSAKTDGKPPLCHADAEHLAAALIYSADEFHTFDRDDKWWDADNKKGCRGLLGLGDNVAGHPLKIRMPQAAQLGML